MTVAAVPDRPAPPAVRRVRLYSWLLLALATFGFAAFWILAALTLERQLAWLAVLGALDIAWMLRLGGWRPGWLRAGMGLAATALTVWVANWGIVAGHLSGPFGLDLATSATKLGGDLFWTLFNLANGGAELIWIGLALAVAAVASR